MFDEAVEQDVVIVTSQTGGCLSFYTGVFFKSELL